MYVSENTFIHLQQAADDRQRRELEYRRIARERAGDHTSTAGRGLGELVRRFRRPARPAPRQLLHP